MLRSARFLKDAYHAGVAAVLLGRTRQRRRSESGGSTALTCRSHRFFVDDGVFLSRFLACTSSRLAVGVRHATCPARGRLARAACETEKREEREARPPISEQFSACECEFFAIKGKKTSEARKKQKRKKKNQNLHFPHPGGRPRQRSRARRRAARAPWPRALHLSHCRISSRPRNRPILQNIGNRSRSL